MTLTPTDKGASIAGVALASIGWLTLFKLDHIAKLCLIDRWINQDKLFGWITRSTANKALTLLFTEIINFSVHGVTNPASVLFACGSTVVNVVMIFVGLPLRMKAKRERPLLLLRSKAASV